MTGLAVVDGSVFDAASATLPAGVLDVVGGRIAGRRELGSAPLPEATTTLDATGCTVVPGFVDLQVNGGYGIDLASEPQRLGELAGVLTRHGVTSWCPTLISGADLRLDLAVDALRTCWAAPISGARPLGLHLEGPLLDPDRRGAHDRSALRLPSPQDAVRWIGAGSADDGRPVVALVTLAPELPGAGELIAELVAAGITVSAGHTSATSEQLADAERAGISGVTHLFNAMSPLSHRAPGVPGAVFASRGLFAGLIVDRHHVDPQIVDLAWRLLGPDRLTLVSDCTALLGLPDGRHPLGAQPVELVGGVPRTSTGVLAGSAVGIDHCLRNLLEITGSPLAAALATVGATPAAWLGRSPLGTFEPGAPGDVVVLDDRLRVVVTVVGGTVLVDTDGRASRR